MGTQITKFTLVAVLGVILSFAMSAPALAEQCSPDGKICLVTDTSQPVVLPTQLEFKVASEATYLSANNPADFANTIGTPIRTFTLVEQGPTGGMSRWIAQLLATDSDYDYMIEIAAQKPTAENNGLEDVSRYTFILPTRSPASGLWTRVVRRGKRFVGEVHYEGRTSITNHVELLLGLNPDVAGYYLKDKGKPVTRGIGQQVIRIAFSRKDVLRRCNPYRYCKLLVEVHQYHTYIDEQGKKRYMQIKPDVDNGFAGRVVRDRRKACKKLRKKRKQFYRQHCKREPPLKHGH